jgi:hypothetical protein
LAQNDINCNYERDKKIYYSNPYSMAEISMIHVIILPPCEIASRGKEPILKIAIFEGKNVEDPKAKGAA